MNIYILKLSNKNYNWEVEREMCFRKNSKKNFIFRVTAKAVVY